MLFVNENHLAVRAVSSPTVRGFLGICVGAGNIAGQDTNRQL